MAKLAQSSPLKLSSMYLISVHNPQHVTSKLLVNALCQESTSPAATLVQANMAIRQSLRLLGDSKDVAGAEAEVIDKTFAKKFSKKKPYRFSG